MKKWLWLVLFLFCWAAAGYGMFGLPRAPGRDDAPLPERPERIVSLAPNLTEILFALGLESQVVGVTLDSDYPPAVKDKPKMGTFWQPNIEAVIAARPDLVITLGFEQQRTLAGRIKRIGYRSLTVSIETVDELFEAIETIGAATATTGPAATTLAELRTKLDRLAALVGQDDKVRVLWVIQREPLRVAGRQTFVNELIELAGGENAIGPTIHKYPPIGSEQVIACAPDVIIEPAMAQDSLEQQQKTALDYWSRFSNVPAVANKRIYVIPPDTVCRLGPRLYQGVETIARCLRPELFEN